MSDACPTPSNCEAPPPAPVLLASQSPRRRRLLAWLGVPFDITAVDTPEELDTPLSAKPAALAEHLAAEKALAAREEGLGLHSLVLTFDTIVVHGGVVLGKPRDVPDAWRMLRSLSGRTHEVVTGVALLFPDAQAPLTLAVTTEVEMKALTDCQIEAWMAYGEFMGCAGAYNIEGQVADVSEAECYQNVAGLPLCHLFAKLGEARGACEALGIAASSPVGACDAALRRRCKLGPSLVIRSAR